MVVRITLRVPNRFTSQAEQSMPLIEPIESPNNTAPISAVEMERISLMAGVRVAQEAINNPGKKKNVNSAQVRRLKALRDEMPVMNSSQRKEGRRQH